MIEVSHSNPVDDEPDEEPLKAYETIQAQQVEQAKKEMDRPARQLLLSSFAAGIEVGFGPLLMALLLTSAHGIYSSPTDELLLATVGNAVGGVVFVALLKYGHAGADSDGSEG